jgi:hypothetical protein
VRRQERRLAAPDFIRGLRRLSDGLRLGISPAAAAALFRATDAAGTGYVALSDALCAHANTVRLQRSRSGQRLGQEELTWPTLAARLRNRQVSLPVSCRFL